MKLLSLLLLSLSLQVEDFKDLYRSVDTLDRINAQVYNRPVRPVWIGKETFIYENQERTGKKFYLVDAVEASKKEISGDRFRELKGKEPERAPWNWNEEVRVTSPDGRYEAFVQDYNVWLKCLDGKEREAYVPAGSPDRGNVIQLSFDGTEQYYYSELHWSPDSKYLAGMQRERVTERQIPLRESAPAGQVQPEVRWLDYAKPGDRLSQKRVVLYEAASRKETEIDMTPFRNQFSLRFGKWHPESRYFTFEYNQRGHQLYQLVAVGLDGSTRVLTEERTGTFVYYNALYRRYLKNGDILWMSERDDWRHLYRIDGRTGETVQLTRGRWNVRDVYQVNEEKGYILFSANGMNAKDEPGGKPVGEDPYNRHLMRLDLADGSLKDLTPEAAEHAVRFNEDHTLFTDVYSRPDQPSVSLLRNIEGETVMELQREDVSDLVRRGWTMPEVFVAKGRDGKTDIWGTIFRPSDFNPRKKYPVVEYIYAGPHDSFVLKDFHAYTRFTKLVELGFIVVTIDGMGTDNRSKSFQDVCWRNLKDSGFPDRILWIQAAAAQYRSMDISNVGVYGYSAGGQSALSALIHYHDFYKVAVALCGCHDNRMDKIWWNEQWMGYPVGPWYSENSNVDQAHRMEGKLLIINGEIDDNVDPASTLQVVKALVKADKDFEQFYLPGYSHNLGDRYVTRKVFEFFYKNMKTEAGRR